VTKSIWRRLSMPLAVLVTGVLWSGCGGENISLPKKIDFVIERPKDDYKESRKEFRRKGASSKIQHDPSGVSRE
jgi:hypothetical protein